MFVTRLSILFRYIESIYYDNVVLIRQQRQQTTVIIYYPAIDFAELENVFRDYPRAGKYIILCADIVSYRFTRCFIVCCCINIEPSLFDILLSGTLRKLIN